MAFSLFSFPIVYEMYFEGGKEAERICHITMNVNRTRICRQHRTQCTMTSACIFVSMGCIRLALKKMHIAHCAEGRRQHQFDLALHLNLYLQYLYLHLHLHLHLYMHLYVHLFLYRLANVCAAKGICIFAGVCGHFRLLFVCLSQCFWSSQEISIFIFAFCKNASSKVTPVAA